jgi:hypothetical protein
MKCYPLHSLHCTVKLVRDICLRVRTWAPLNNWIIELLCEKALSSIAMPLSPGDAIRRLFEVMSSGVYLNSLFYFLIILSRKLSRKISI